MKTCLILTLFTLPILSTTGCITTEDSYETTRDPIRAQGMERELKTDDDWAQWNKMKKHNNRALFIIED